MAFFEFNIGVSGMFASQRGLIVSGNNISNASTKGYSRQTLNQKADKPLAGIGIGMTGTGVATISVLRERNTLLDEKMWYQNARLGEYDVKKAQHSIIETVYGEPSDDGFTNVFDQLYSAIVEVGKNPSGNDQKKILRQQALNFCTYYNNITTSLQKYQNDLNSDLKSRVEEINNLASRIQNLNRQVFEAEMYGDEASNFRDERDLCIDRLSQIIDTQVVMDKKVIGERTFETCKVSIAGNVLVDHEYAWKLELKVRADKLNPEDANGLYDITWSNGMTFDMKCKGHSGELTGIIQMRDGCGTGEPVEYNGIPYYISRMDNYVRTFAKAMNEEYSKDADGYIEIKDLSLVDIHNANKTARYMKKEEDGSYSFYSSKDDTTGIDLNEEQKKAAHDSAQLKNLKDILFSYSDNGRYPVENPDFSNNYEKMTASNFTISDKLFNHAEDIKTVFDGDEESGTRFMQALYQLKDDKKMFKEGDPKDYMVAIFSELGIGAKEATMYYNTQKAVTNNIENERLSVSQVSISDEFTNLIKYQQAYQAAAKFITTMDDVYNTTIFKLGNF